MHMLEARERIELLDPRLHVVPGDLLPIGDPTKINIVDLRLVRGDHRVSIIATEIDSEITLGREHRQPQPPFGDDLALRRPDLTHPDRGVPVGQHIADDHALRSLSLSSGHPRRLFSDVGAIEGAVELDLADARIGP